MQELKSQDFIKSSENIRLMRLKESGGYSTHTHSFIEIVYICGGKGVHEINGHRYSVKRGDLLFINFEEHHSFTCDEMEYINLLINPEFLDRELLNSENALDILTLSTFKDFASIEGGMEPHIAFQGSEMLEVEMLFELMLSEFEKKYPGYITVLKSYANVLLTKIFRAMRRPVHADGAGSLRKIAPEVLKYIEENHNRKISLKELAASSFYHANYFSSMFHECFGKTLTEYISEVRVQKAMKLLIETALPIEEICRLVGYENKKQFYKRFKDIAGMTPQAFRSSKISEN